jgi:hypothetical protein
MWPKQRSPLWKIPVEELQRIVSESITLSEILTKVHLTDNGTVMATLKKVMKERGIDYKHILIGRNTETYTKIKNKIWEQKYTEYIQRWLRGEEKGWVGKGCSVSTFIRRFLFEQNHYRCQECGWDKIHPLTKRVPLQIDHIDGNAKNCGPDNLRLLCPNCHSLTPTFGRLNKVSVRTHR